MSIWSTRDNLNIITQVVVVVVVLSSGSIGRNVLSHRPSRITDGPIGPCHGPWSGHVSVLIRHRKRGLMLRVTGMMSMRSRCRITMLKVVRLRSSDATDMSVKFTGDASIKPLVLTDLEAYVAREAFIGSIRRVKRKFKAVLWMRLVDDREGIVSAKSMDVEVATRALVAKTSAYDATTIAVEVSTVVDRRHEKG